ncbi:hypothetical protein [Parapedobacter tibetensis]|nr:hypothetical protein [Parapedobacter tibetensis]
MVKGELVFGDNQLENVANGLTSVKNQFAFALCRLETAENRL